MSQVQVLPFPSFIVISERQKESAIKMKILVACEESQEVCKAFREKGHEVYSCDVQECSGGHPEWHIQDDVVPLLRGGVLQNVGWNRAQRGSLGSYYCTSTVHISDCLRERLV